MMKPNYVRVIIDRAIQREFDYSVPETLADRIDIGSRVRVPFRDKSALATVLATLEQSDAKGIRPIEALVGEGPAISESLLELAKWMSAYYCCPLETVIRSLLPQVIRRAEVGWKKRLLVQPLTKIENSEAGVADKIDNLRKRAPRQAELFDAIVRLEKPMPAAELLRKTSFDNQTLRALVKRGLVKLREETVERDPHADEQFVATTNLELNAEQALALNKITDALAAPERAKPILLHGVTGSGKTEIYLQAIRVALERGRSAIVLVPEISLTPQTVERFKSRFAEMHEAVAVLHSHLSQGERHDEWHKIHSGRARIVIGARSAVFAPLKDVGLIIVDEEHETTYKQEEAPRYHARDVAVVRAKIEKCAVVLGSATLSCARRRGGPRQDREMRSGSRKRHAVARELSQCDDRQIRTPYPEPARGRPTHAADADCRSSPGAPKRKDRSYSFGEIVAGNRGPTRKTRADDSVFKPARFFHLTALQQLRRSAQLSELQRRFDFPSAHGPIELPSLRTHRGRAEEMSGVRQRFPDLRRIRDRES